jgi:hypothetical protein
LHFVKSQARDFRLWWQRSTQTIDKSRFSSNLDSPKLLLASRAVSGRSGAGWAAHIEFRLLLRVTSKLLNRRGRRDSRERGEKFVIFFEFFLPVFRLLRAVFLTEIGDANLVGCYPVENG